MNNDTKVLLIIGGLTLAIVAFIVVGSGSSGGKADAEVINRGGVATGSATAKVSLTEFSDFFCPACKAVNPVVDQILAKYNGQLKFVYKHFPLPQHPLAFKAAQAAQAADLQGKFWLYHDKLFENQDNLKEDSFTKIAHDLGLNLDKFKNDLNSDDVVKKVQSDLDDAKKLNLPGTPSFFINGEKLNLNSFDDLVNEVEAKIKEAK